MNIVANLMGISQEDLTDPWMELYVTELSKCEGIPIEPLGQNLYPLAEKCYQALFDFKTHKTITVWVLSVRVKIVR